MIKLGKQIAIIVISLLVLAGGLIPASAAEPGGVLMKKGRSTRARSSKKGGSRAKSKGRRGRRSGKSSARSRRGRHQRDGQEVARSVPRGGGGIAADRVTEIQAALIKAGYLDGPPTGQYDDSTSTAMKRFQTDRGLPATGYPSATSLRALGVTKTANDGYATPIKRATQSTKSAGSAKQDEQP